VTGPLAQQFARFEERARRFAEMGMQSIATGIREDCAAIERHAQDMGLEAFEALRDVEALAENGKLAGDLDEAEALFEEIRDRALAALPAREKGEE